ncbi:hypothetical protein J6590_097434, partial [Homalodisca vitripennis]
MDNFSSTPDQSRCYQMHPPQHCSVDLVPAWHSINSVSPRRMTSGWRPSCPLKNRRCEKLRSTIDGQHLR